MNIQRFTPPDRPRPARFTTEAYIAGRSVINQLFEKTELLDGVIYEMPADGPLTTKWNNALLRWLFGALGDDFVITPDKTLKAGELWAPTPDIFVHAAELDEADVWAKDTLLVVEVSDTTLEYDLGEKASMYADHGVREYWVVDPNAKCIHVHHRGADGHYGAPERVGFEDTLNARHIPGLTLRLADLPRIS